MLVTEHSERVDYDTCDYVDHYDVDDDVERGIKQEAPIVDACSCGFIILREQPPPDASVLLVS